MTINIWQHRSSKQPMKNQNVITQSKQPMKVKCDNIKQVSNQWKSRCDNTQSSNQWEWYYNIEQVRNQLKSGCDNTEQVCNQWKTWCDNLQKVSN